MDKLVSITPRAAEAAGCIATCESYASGTTGAESWTNYSCNATAVGEWVLLRWDFVTTYTYRDGHTSTQSWTRDAYNPYPPTRRDDMSVSPYDATYTYSGALYPSDLISATFTVTAVFYKDSSEESSDDSSDEPYPPGPDSSEDSSEDSSDDSSEDSSEEPPGPDSSDDSSEEWEDGPLLYNPKTGNLRYNPLTNHLRYKHRQIS